MKALLFQDELRLADIPVPAIGPGEALVAVEACGLCGTDLMKLAAKARGSILGHEIAGRIARLGSSVRGFQEGDRVVLAHHVPCLECHYCRRGHASMCRQFKATNVDPGGFADYVRAPQAHVRHTLLKIPQDLDYLSASQTEPLACCLRNVKRLGTGPGDTVGIVGLGSIGLLTAQLLALRGVRVLGLDIDARRAEGIAGWGRGVSAAEAFAEAASAETQGRGLDALILTAGPSGLAAQGLQWLRDGGTLNVFAGLNPSQASLDLNQVYHRELTLMSSYSPSLEDLREALGLIASGAVSVSALKARTYALEEFAEAERQVRSREALKAILVPSAGSGLAA